jgi:two-component system, cell cycle sensor histidine kinase and response regulator CckA
MLDDLRRARAFSSVFDEVPFGVCLVELDGRIAHANQTLTRLLGADLRARVMTTDVTHPKDRALSCRLFDDLAAGRRETFSLDKRYVAAGGQAVVARSTVVLVRDGEGHPDFSIGYIEPSGELAQLRERAIEAMTAAHDLNNLLTALFGHQELLLRALPADDKRRGAVEAIGDVARMSVPIVQDMLRDRTRCPEAVDVNALILGMRSVAAQLVGSNVEIVLRLDPTIPPVVVERDLLERSIANIATNAHDAMQDGGTFVIETTSEEAFVKILLSDTGIGIPPGLRSRIFDRDFTTKPHGHGIGLALTRETVERAGGFVSVDSEPGRGAIFTLAFPRRTEGAGQPEGGR